MSTNYYFVTKDKEFAEKYFGEEYTVVPYTPHSEECFNPQYKIHIGKRSIGWQPLFQEHNVAYTSVEEMLEFAKVHSDKIKIIDEYNTEFTLEELKHELIDWGKDAKIVYWKFMPEGIPDPFFGGKTYFVEGTRDDYNLLGPFDHIEYEKFDKLKKDSTRIYCRIDDFFFHDKDGYNFTRGEFS